MQTPIPLTLKRMVTLAVPLLLRTTMSTKFGVEPHWVLVCAVTVTVQEMYSKSAQTFGSAISAVGLEHNHHIVLEWM